MLVCGSLIATGGSRPLNGQAELDSWSQTVVNQAVARISDSVVQIETIGGLDRIQGAAISDGPTTGTVVSQDGFILTSSFNLLQQPSAIFVKLADGTRLPANIVAHNESRQVVLLKVVPKANLPVPNFIDRAQMQVGQTVIAVGKVFNASQPNISTGILSAKDRIWGKAIQTDAKISPNNFGGPLIDLEGNLLGILVPLSPTTSKVSGGSEWYDSGIGFAVPLNELKLDRMAAGDTVRDGLIGITFNENKGMASAPVIAACPKTSPAAKAGMLPGDRITKINQIPIQRVNQAKHALGPLYAGDQVNIAVVRDQETLEFDVTMVGEIEPFRHPMLGILPASDEATGISVRRVIAGTAAEQAGLQTGDRILAINQKPLQGIEGLATQMMESAIGSDVELQVMRQDQTRQITATLEPLDAKLLPATSPALDQDEFPDDRLVNIRIPEQPNECFAYIPDQDPAAPSLGLLIWIGSPGPFEPKQELAKWKSWCDQHHVAVVIPQSRNDKAWIPAELELLTKVARQITTDNDINPYTIAVGGEGSGGVLASIFAMTERSLVRGLILKDTAISKRVNKVQSDAANRLLALIVDTPHKNHADALLQTSLKTLTANGFPAVLNATQASDVQGEIIGWVGSLDRF